jgi:homoserine kinase
MMVGQSDKEYIANFWQERSSHPDSVSVRVPASTANLGPGFDTVALALGIYLKLTLTLLSENDERIPLVTSLDGDNESLGFSAYEFVSNILNEHVELESNILKRIRIFIQSEIPPERGLGSSAAVIVGILWAAAKLKGKVIKGSEILTQAAIIEGHADNAAASLLGGLVVVANSSDGKMVVAQKLVWPEKWEAILVIPARPVPTIEARRLLPENIPYTDAIYNLQHVALLLAAVQNESENLMHEALHDRLHEKYRSQLVPELAELKKQLSAGPALGCVLSGSGSSVLVLVQADNIKETVKKIELWQKTQNNQCDLLTLTVDQKGVQELNDRRN